MQADCFHHSQILNVNTIQVAGIEFPATGFAVVWRHIPLVPELAGWVIGQGFLNLTVVLNQA